MWKREGLGKDQDKVDSNQRSTKEMKVEEKRVVAKWESSSTASSSDNEDGGEMVVGRIVDKQDGHLEDKEVAFKCFEFDISSSFLNTGCLGGPGHRCGVGARVCGPTRQSKVSSFSLHFMTCIIVHCIREDIDEKKTFSFGHCPNEGGGIYPCPNFWPFFKKCIFGQ